MNGKSRSRIVITGTYCSLNKGDAAMRIALTDALKEAVPDCHVTMMTPFPELDGSAYRSDVTLKCSRRRPVKALGLILLASVWHVIYRVFRLDFRFMLNNEMRVYRESDVVVDLSGDGLTEEYGTKCLIAHLIPIVLGKLLAKPVFVCAQTIGPFNKNEALCRWILKKTDVVSAREKLTYDYLSKLGLNGTTLSLTADMAFLVGAVPPETARNILAKEGVTFDKPIIGFSISRLPGHILGSAEERKATNLELELAETLDKLVEAGMHPVFVSHATGPGDRRDDRKAARRVANISRHSSEITVLEGDYSAEEIKGIISQMELFAGVRMHSCIAAMSMCVPTAVIAYGPKAYGIAGLAGQSRWVLDIRNITSGELFDTLQQLWQKRESVRRSLREEMAVINKLAGENVAIIQTLLSKKD
ncbi:MAG: polysaccharide pyruvyl transferase family protein [Armatimonadota bacterium]